MFVAQTRITDNTNVAADLKAMFPLGPREIIEKIMNRDLRVVAVGKAGVQTIELVPWLVRVADKTSALASEAPMKIVNYCRAKHSRVSKDEALAVIGQSLLRR